MQNKIVFFLFPIIVFKNLKTGSVKKTGGNASKKLVYKCCTGYFFEGFS